MDKQRNEQEYETYDSLILEKENHVDTTNHELKKVRRVVQTVLEDIYIEFRKLAIVTEEAGSHGAIRHDQNAEQERLFHQLLSTSEEQVTKEYQTEVRRCNDEIDTLYRKRSEIRWD